MEKATLPDTHMMTTGLKITKPSTGTENLHCPQCRRTHLVARTGIVTVQKGKKVQSALAECRFCGLISTVEQRQFTNELFLAETFFPGNPNVELQETSGV
jgi:transcription elongation factor Elf1